MSDMEQILTEDMPDDLLRLRTWAKAKALENATLRAELKQAEADAFLAGLTEKDVALSAAIHVMARLAVIHGDTITEAVDYLRLNQLAAEEIIREFYGEWKVR